VIIRMVSSLVWCMSWLPDDALVNICHRKGSSVPLFVCQISFQSVQGVFNCLVSESDIKLAAFLFHLALSPFVEKFRMLVLANGLAWIDAIQWQEASY
jgi:hypothetical protein